MLKRWVVPVSIVLGLAVATDASAQSNFRLLAGASPAGADDGTGGSAQFNVPVGIAVNSTGTIYVTDSANSTIRAVTAGGTVSTFAGTSGNYGSIDGTGNAAKFTSPQGAAVDSAGNVYIADSFAHTIRKITPAGVVTTIAGLAFNIGSTDGTGSAARFNTPRGVAVDATGNVFVTDTNNQTIRMVTPAGVVTTIAGLAGSSGTADGTGNVARFNFPRGIAVDPTGNLYVADSNSQTIRKIAAGGVVTTLAGLANTPSFVDATGTAARFSQPRGLAIDAAGSNLYVADTNNNRIRQITLPGAVVTTVAGNGGQGGFDNTALSARFNAPEGVAIDAGGALYVADTISDTIRKISGGNVTTLAGFYGSLNNVDGVGPAARLSAPNGAALDASGNLYVPDRVSNTIRKVTPSGTVTTFAGLAFNSGSADGTGSAARFSAPQAVAVDNGGNVWVADTNNQLIRMITPAGVVSTVAGLAGTSGTADGTGSAARFSFPRGIGVDSVGNVYVSDSNAATIRKIAPGAIVTTFAGLANTNGSLDGTGSAARFNQPRGMAVDSAGNIFVTDANNNTIRKITPAAVVTTIAGLAGSPGFSDGTGSAARFANPNAIAVDSIGTLYVADTGQSTIRKITAGNVVTTIAGCPGCVGSDKYGRFNGPAGIAVNARGELFVADTRNNTILTTAPIRSALVLDFGSAYGLWIRVGAAWRQLNPHTTEGMMTISDGQQDGLIVDFGPGVGLWIWESDQYGDEFWFQLTPNSPTEMAPLDVDGDGNTDYGVFTFPGQGVWVFGGQNDDWFQLHPLDASHLSTADLDGDFGDDIVIDFPGAGIWVYYPMTDTWAQIVAGDASAVISADVDGNGHKDVVAAFPGAGVWSYRGGIGWSQINANNATRLASADLDGNGRADLIFDFGASVGVWVLQNGTTWWQLSSLSTEGIKTGDLDANGHAEVIVDLGIYGVWSYEDLAGWQQIAPLNATGIATGRFY